MMGKRRFLLIALALLACISVRVALAVPCALTRQPWCDEAWFASPALNLLEKGQMGTSVKESAGFAFTRIDEHTYWQPPLYFLAQARWYSMFGFSLFTMRFLSVFFGLILLVSMFSIVKALTEDDMAGLLAAGLSAVDFVLVGFGAEGRMDTMSAALAFSGLAVYLSLRKRNLLVAMLAGHSLIAAGGLTHPNGIVALAGMVFLNFFYDRRSIKLKHVMAALIPYVLGGAGWGLYILQDPQAFVDQFLGNMVSRLHGSHSISNALQSEISGRYLATYGFEEGSSAFSKLKILVLLVYLAGAAGASLTRDLSGQKGVRALLFLLILFIAVFAILIGNKSPRYLVHILPLFMCATGIWIAWCWRRSSLLRSCVVGGLMLLVILQLGVSYGRIRQDLYRTIYLPAISELMQLDYESGIIMGSAELAFSLGFRQNLVDDPRLGFVSGKRPDIVVIEARYRSRFEVYKREEPETYRWVSQLLSDEFISVHRNGFYEIYVRKAEPQSFGGDPDLFYDEVHMRPENGELLVRDLLSTEAERD